METPAAAAGVAAGEVFLTAGGVGPAAGLRPLSDARVAPSAGTAAAAALAGAAAVEAEVAEAGAGEEGDLPAARVLPREGAEEGVALPVACWTVCPMDVGLAAPTGAARPAKMSLCSHHSLSHDAS